MTKIKVDKLDKREQEATNLLSLCLVMAEMLYEDAESWGRCEADAVEAKKAHDQRIMLIKSLANKHE